MLRALVAFEWRFQTRQITFWAAAAGFFFFGLALASTGFGPARVPMHSPWLVAEYLGFISMTAVIATSSFSAHALVRDVEHKMEEVLGATPAPVFTRLAGRFIGSFLALLAAFSLCLPGLWLASALPFVEAARVAPFQLAPYLWGMAVMVVPSLLLAASVQFALAAISRNAMVCHAGAIAMYGLYFAASALTESPLMAASSAGAAGTGWFAIIDPFGLAPFFEQTMWWAEVDQRVRYVSLEGSFLVNRLVTLGLAAGFLALAFHWARRSHTSPSTGPTAQVEPSPVETHLPRTYRHPWTATWWSATRIEVRALMVSSPTWLLCTVWAIVGSIEVFSKLRSGEYGVGYLAATGLVMGELDQLLGLMGGLAVLAAAAEVFWRERVFHFTDTVLATPASRSALLAAKWSALAVLVLAMAGIGVLITIAAQLIHGGGTLEPAHWLAFSLFKAWPLLVVSAGTLFVHSRSPNKYVGLALSAAALLVFWRAQSLGLSHPLWRFSVAPVPKWSALSGYGGGVPAFIALMTHWSFVAVLLLLSAARQFRWPMLALPVVSGLIILVAAGPFESRAETLQWKADYERTWKHEASTPQPTITQLQFELAHQSQSLQVKGRNVLVNRTGQPLREVLVSVMREAKNVKVSVDHAVLTSSDARFAMHRFQLDAPLAPGGQTTLDYEYGLAPSWLQPDDSLADEGAVVLGFLVLPRIGYRETYELRDARDRAKQGLAPRADDEDDAHGESNQSWEEVTFDATVSTLAENHLAGPGELTRTWLESNRRFAHFESTVPVVNNLVFAAARYELMRRQHGSTSIEVLFHPAHRANVDHVLESAGQMLSTLEASLGPYKHPVLRIAEVPRQWPFGGYATAGAFFLNEERVFLVDGRHASRVDLIARRVAHETAHQWFGHQFVPHRGPGASFVMESLAKDAELRVLRPAQVEQVLSFEHDRYLKGRAAADGPEVSLARVGSEPWLYYSKGAIVMRAVRELLGDAAVDQVLREHGASAAEVISGLEAAAAEPDASLVRRWFETTELDDVSIRQARRSHDDSSVSLEIHSAFDSGPVAIELLDETGPIVREVHRLAAGLNHVAIKSPRRATRAVVDPGYVRLELKRADNAHSVD